MLNLFTIGTILIIIGGALLLFGNFISEQTVIAYFWLTGSFSSSGAKKINYYSTRKFYWLAGIYLICIGTVFLSKRLL
jgi:hypothetical protein